MDNSKPLVNKVANSSLITINLEDFYPKEAILEFDIKPYLFKEIILKEKDFRLSLKEIDWSIYEGKILTIFCSSDAIIPVWAYMLISANVAPYASLIYQGTKTEFLSSFYQQTIEEMEFDKFAQQRIVVKGCSNKPVPASAYALITAKLQPYAQSIMYGEPCSTVPIFKRPRVV